MPVGNWQNTPVAVGDYRERNGQFSQIFHSYQKGLVYIQWQAQMIIFRHFEKWIYNGTDFEKEQYDESLWIYYFYPEAFFFK